MWPSTATRFRFLVVAVLLLLLLNLDTANAGVSEHLFLPLPGKRIRNNARLEVESRWVVGNGYRPVKVTIVNMPPGPTKYDRDFRVRLTPHGYYGQGTNVLTEAIVEIPEGAAQGSAWLAVPQIQGWQNIDIEVREGGQRIDELTQHGMQLTSNVNYMGNNAYNEAMPSVLFIDGNTPLRATRDSLVNQFRATGSSSVKSPTFDLPDIRMWQNIVPHANDPWNRNSMAAVVGPGAGRANDVEILNLISQNQKLEILHPSELPNHWLHYTCLDLVVISLDDALQLAKTHPDHWDAICQWMASGPTLIVTGVGNDFGRLDELEKLAKFSEEPVRPGDLENHGGWTVARAEFASGRVRAVDTAVHSEYGAVNELAPSNISIDTSKPPFVIRTIGMGRVAVLTKSDALENPPNDMAWLLNQLEARNWMNYQRHGISFVRQNSDFMTFLIEGTGRVPVWSFLVLITGFVVVIGPINYVLLKRWRRLFLLLVTVPLGAAIITVSLFSYALVSDGLGVRMRARSYTRLDQRTGATAIWARQSYYAGLAPSGGLRFPADAAVYPIDERPWGGGSRVREIAWSDDIQQLRSGFISSRQTSQYLVIRSSKSDRKLQVRNAESNAPLTVVNQLGANIAHLVIRDKQGNFYMGQELKAGEKAVLSKPVRSDKKDLTLSEEYQVAIKPFSLAYNDRRPTAPVGYQTDDYSGGLFGFTRGNRRYYYDPGYERGLPTPSFSTSILERELQRTSTNNAVELEPGTYLAILTTSPEMPLGHRTLREQGSFHILEGRW